MSLRRLSRMQRIILLCAFGGSSSRIVDDEGGGAPDWLPAGAVAFADFKNGRYYMGGQVVSLTDMFGEDPNYGPFDPSQAVQSGVGLLSPPDAAGPAFAALQGSALTAVLNGATVVLTGNRITEATFPFVPGIELYDESFSVDMYVTNNDDFRIGTFVGDNTSNVSIFADNTGLDGFVTIALNVSATNMDAFSTKGSPVALNNKTISPAATGAVVYAFNRPGVTVETLIIYPPVDDAVLPYLSGGALAYSDFKQGLYAIGGTAKTLGDLWVGSEDWSATVPIVPGEGAQGEGGYIGTTSLKAALPYAGEGYAFVAKVNLGWSNSGLEVDTVDLPSYNQYALALVGSPFRQVYNMGTEGVDREVINSVIPIQYPSEQTFAGVISKDGVKLLMATGEGYDLPTGPAGPLTVNTVAFYNGGAVPEGPTTTRFITHFPVDTDLATLLGLPSWLPRGATFHADFVNGRYWDHGLVADPNTIFATDAVDGDVWDAGLIVPGVGYGDPTGVDGPGGKIIGPSALSSSGPELTLVAEFTSYENMLGQFGFYAWDGTEDYNTFWYYSGRASFNAQLSDAGSGTVSSSVVVGTGLNRVAVTMSKSTGKMAASLNGGPVFEISSADIGADLWANLTFSVFQAPLRTMTIYPAQTNEKLRDLSSLRPEGATFFADFVNGYYYDHGYVEDPNTIFADDPIDGDPWVPGDIVPGVGYQADAGVGGMLIGPSAADAKQFSALFEINVTDPANVGFYLSPHSSDYASFYAYMAFRYSSLLSLSDINVTNNVQTKQLSAGTHKFAATLDTANSKLAAVLDDGTFFDYPSPELGTGDVSGFPFWIDGAFSLRSLTLFPVKTDAEIKALVGLPEWLPEGARFHADFVNGRYWDRGLVTDPSTIFGDDAGYGVTWRSENVVPGSGYRGNTSPGDDGGKFIGPSALTSRPSFTAVAEFKTSDGPSAQFDLVAYDGDTYASNLDIAVGAGINDTNNTLATGPVATLGLNRIAITMDGSGPRFAYSINGGAAVPFEDVDIGADVWGSLAFYIYQGGGFDPADLRSLTLYPVQTDEQLQVLSATAGPQNFIWQNVNEGVTVSGDHRTVTAFTPGDGSFATIPTSWFASYGKWHAEFMLSAIVPNLDIGLGFAKLQDFSTTTGFPGGGTGDIYNDAAMLWFHDNSTYTGTGMIGANAPDIGTVAPGDVWMLEWDVEAGKGWLGKNGVWLTGDPATGTNPWVTWTPGAGVSPILVVKDHGPLDALVMIPQYAWYTPSSGFSVFTD